MKMICITTTLIFLFFTLAASVKISSKEMFNEFTQTITSSKKIEKKIIDLIEEAKKEKDVSWKICLENALVTSKGIVASITQAQSRMRDLLSIEKKQAAYSQLVLARGLKDSLDNISAEALSCPRKNSTIQSKTTIESDVNNNLTGTYDGNDSINASMGMGFSQDFATEKNQASISGDGLDNAGTDISGGPVDTPGNQGEDPGMIDDNEIISSVPPVKPVSNES